MPPIDPGQAVRLLRDPQRQRYASNFRVNPSFSRQAATTRDWQGKRLVDVITPTTVDDTTVWLSRTVDSLLEGDRVELDPLRQSTVPKRKGGTRDIWVMSYRRRALSNLIAGVLEDTTSHQLRAHVRGYIPGLREAVKNTVLDIAEAVAAGRVIKFVNEDVKNCFDVLPFELIEDSLRHYGFSSEVRALVLASVRAPRWVKSPGAAGRLLTFHRGIPMGLTEAAVLANLAFYEFDANAANIRDTVVARYSDNIFVGTPSPEVAVRAARVLLRWTRSRGLQLKGVHHRAGPRSLVRDVRNQRVSFLGAEIDCNGEVHLPPSVLRKKLTSIGEHMARWERHVSEFGNHFSGRSRHAGGVGTDVMDLDDIRNAAVGFADYWAQLNEVDAQRFHRVVDRRHPGLLLSESTPAAAWEASLGSQQMVESEDELNHPFSSASSTALPSLNISSASRAESGTRKARSLRVPARDLASTGENDHEDNSLQDSHSHSEMTPWTGPLSHMPHMGLVEGDVVECAALQGYAFHHAEGNEAPHTPLHPVREVLSQVVASPLDARFFGPRSSMAAGPGRADPPSAPGSDNFLHIHSKWSRSSNGASGAAVVIRYGAAAKFISHFPNVRAEVALVRTITAEVRNAIARGHNELIIYTDPWLPKMLLSRQRRFRSPILFADVLSLHRIAASGNIFVCLRSEDPHSNEAPIPGEDSPVFSNGAL